MAAFDGKGPGSLNFAGIERKVEQIAASTRDGSGVLNMLKERNSVSTFGQ